MHNLIVLVLNNNKNIKIFKCIKNQYKNGFYFIKMLNNNNKKLRMKMSLFQYSFNIKTIKTSSTDYEKYTQKTSEFGMLNIFTYVSYNLLIMVKQKKRNFII